MSTRVVKQERKEKTGGEGKRKVGRTGEDWGGERKAGEGRGETDFFLSQQPKHCSLLAGLRSE